MLSKKKLLLVEDNRADAVLVQLALDDTQANLDLLHLADGEKMMQYMQNQHSDDVSFILLDLNIPKANGLEILKAKSQFEGWKLVPVVVYSSSTRKEDIQGCLTSGANAYMCKHVDFDTFNKSLCSAIHFWNDIALS